MTGLFPDSKAKEKLIFVYHEMWQKLASFPANCVYRQSMEDMMTKRAESTVSPLLEGEEICAELLLQQAKDELDVMDTIRSAN